MQEKGEESHPKLEERRWGRSLGEVLVAGVERGEEENKFHVAFTLHKQTTRPCMHVRERGGKRRRRGREREKEKLTRAGGERRERRRRWPEAAAGVLGKRAWEREREG